jgi:putative ABC transport system permease protein
MLKRFLAMFRSRAMDRDFEQEIQTHLELAKQEHVRRGLTPDQAKRAARIELGGLASLKEQHREVRGLAWLETIWLDLRYAGRMLRKDPWFSSAAVTILTLGIGVNTVGFTIINTAFIKGVPVKDGSTLVQPCFKLRNGTRCQVAAPELRQIDALGSASELGAWSTGVVKLSDDYAYPEQADAVWVTPNLFEMLGYQPAIGRNFTSAEERERVVLIGYNIWRNRFASDPRVMGKTIRIDGQTATVIGVMPQGMGFPDHHQIWGPWKAFRPDREDRWNSQVFNALIRLRPGVTRAAAEAELTSVAKQVAIASPPSEVGGAYVRGFSEAFGLGRARNMFLVVMGAVCFVLLIACANVANLLLSRSGYRMPEMEVRMSLGATRWRLVRQLILESVLLGTMGGIFGFALASIGMPLLESALPAEKPYWIVFPLDYHVIAYVAALCVGTAVLFGLAPALRLSQVANTGALKGRARGTHATRWSSALSGVLVVTEIALAVILLVGAGLMMRSFAKLYSMDLGFPSENLTVFGFDLFGDRYKEVSERNQFISEWETLVRAAPGIEAVAITSGVPPRDRSERPLEIEGSSNEAELVSTAAITPQYIGTLAVPLLRGRNFGELDGLPGGETVLINERLAQRYFPGQDPIGKRLRFASVRPQPGRPPDAWRTVVGVLPTIRQASLSDAYLNSVVYLPYRQEADSGSYMIVRSRQPLSTVAQAVRQAASKLDSGQPIRGGMSLDQWAAQEQWPYRVFGTLFVVMAAIALALSSIGLYAVLAYVVAQRTPEIGVRMAVGASHREIAWLVLRRGLWQLAIGLTLGICGALAVSGVLSGVLVEIRPNDPVTFGGIVLLLSVVSITACTVPARRAARVDPVVALRAN